MSEAIRQSCRGMIQQYFATIFCFAAISLLYLLSVANAEETRVVVAYSSINPEFFPSGNRAGARFLSQIRLGPGDHSRAQQRDGDRRFGCRQHSIRIYWRLRRF